MIGQTNRETNIDYIFYMYRYIHFYSLKIFKNFHKARKNPENKVKPEKNKKSSFIQLLIKYNKRIMINKLYILITKKTV